MKERPILFSGPMVRAILEGRKTMTRRVVKGYTPQECKGFHECRIEGIHGKWYINVKLATLPGEWLVNMKYGIPGDRLWVKETFRPVELPSGLDGVDYRADRAFKPIEDTKEAAAKWLEARRGDRWRPSMFMPRWASRITLEITGVRVERLRDITEEDARAEGVTIPEYDASLAPVTIGGFTSGPARIAFKELWDRINSERGFDWLSNPWVWVVEFKRI